MNKFNRRRFLQLAGASSAAAGAAALLPAAALVTRSNNHEIFRFRGVAGLPQPPLATYASYVVEGRVDLKTGSGTVTKTVFAGDPEAMSAIALPGLSRIVRVIGVRQLNGRILIKGVIDSSSQLVKNERPSVEIVLDPSAGVGRTDFLGTEVPLRLET